MINSNAEIIIRDTVYRTVKSNLYFQCDISLSTLIYSGIYRAIPFSIDGLIIYKIAFLIRDNYYKCYIKL